MKLNEKVFRNPLRTAFNSLNAEDPLPKKLRPALKALTKCQDGEKKRAWGLWKMASLAG